MQRRVRYTTQTAGIAIAMAALMATAEAQESPRQTSSQRFVLAEGRISFVAPPGFSALSAELLAVKYPNAGAPRRAIGNARLTTSIAYDLRDDVLPPPVHDLNVLRKLIMEHLAQLPKLKWVASDVRAVGGREWVYLEFTAAAADQDIHNIYLASVYDSRLLLFNFNSTAAEFATVEPALRKSLSTITTKP